MSSRRRPRMAPRWSMGSTVTSFVSGRMGYISQAATFPGQEVPKYQGGHSVQQNEVKVSVLHPGEFSEEKNTTHVYHGAQLRREDEVPRSMSPLKTNPPNPAPSVASILLTSCPGQPPLCPQNLPSLFSALKPCTPPRNDNHEIAKTLGRLAPPPHPIWQGGLS